MRSGRTGAPAAQQEHPAPGPGVGHARPIASHALTLGGRDPPLPREQAPGPPPAGASHGPPRTRPTAAPPSLPVDCTASPPPLPQWQAVQARQPLQTLPVNPRPPGPDLSPKGLAPDLHSPSAASSRAPVPEWELKERQTIINRRIAALQAEIARRQLFTDPVPHPGPGPALGSPAGALRHGQV